jgi:DNA-binding beta-propeller fold protein YncE
MRFLAPLLAGLTLMPVAGAAEPAPLVLEAKIPLGKVSGRIDHFAVDPGRQRLFVAELGNDSVGVVDLKQGQVIKRISGLREPQGVGYVPWTDTLYVANAGDGSVHLYRADDFAPAGSIELGDDADNIRVDDRGKKVFIGYGEGALAEVDPATRMKVADIRLKAHPESFQLDPTGARIFVNLPDARSIAVVDVAARRETATLPAASERANFPMAIDPESGRVVVVFRSPPKLMAFTSDGRRAAEAETCGDSDDVFVDAKRKRLYVSCGAGYIDVFAAAGDGYQRIASLPTASGARTSLFVPALDRLYLGVRATGLEPPAIWVFRPTP